MESSRRPGLLQSYLAEMTTYIERKYNCPRDKALSIVKEVCRERYQPMTAIIEETRIDGRPEIKAVDLAQFWEANAGNLISPSGSVYMQHEKKLGTTINMIIQRLAERKQHKKAMLKAKADGDIVAEMTHYFMQTLIKININSLPGNYGSPYSIFYSKANYNAITSAGRALIGYAYSCIEAVLGGNFAWFSMNELVNHLIIHMTKGIDKVRVRNCMDKYRMKWVTAEDLMDFYKKTMCKYKKYKDFSKVEAVVAKLSTEEIQYFYYFQNLRHILMGNDEIFRPWLNDMFDVSKVKMDDNVDPKELFDLDGALVTFVNVAFHKYVDPEDPKIQVYDLPKKRPDLAKKFVCIARYMDKKLHEGDEFFGTFIFTPLNMPKVQTRKAMLRNSAVISDTDSVIFTVKDWIKWYTGDVYDISDKAYQIACCMIYWITQAVAHTLYIYSIAHGARGKFAKVMAMKNEFLYPSLIVADVKKHYAGIVSVQEGVILPKPDVDIKGVQFKGSDICKEATTFAKDFIEWNLYELYNHGTISAHEAIKKVRDFEDSIRKDIMTGSTAWYKSLSIKPKADYKTPWQSNWYYYYAWQKIFAEKYGDIMIPMKCPAVPVNKPTMAYFDWLSKKDPKIAKRFRDFLTSNNADGGPPRAPTLFAVNPVGGKVPPELVPLIKVTDIIHHNSKPCHLFLKQVGASCGFDSNKLLYSDVYPFDPDEITGAADITNDGKII